MYFIIMNYLYIVYLINQFYYDQLENIPECMNLINAAAQIVQSPFLKQITISSWVHNV